MMKTMISLLIDGYNLLHVIEKGFIKSLQQKRNDLIEKLHFYQVEKNVNITVIFDGSQPFPGSQRRDRYGNLEIIYTPPESSADDWISEECERNYGSFIVVSSDQEIIRDAERFGCITLSSQEFLKKLSQLTRPLDNPYLEDKETPDEGPETLYPRVTTRKKGVAKRLPKRERRKYHQLKNL